mgnify:CR=1 FL=1
MKNTLFNVTFTAVFLGLFLLILYTFSDTLQGVFTSQQPLYPNDKSLGINSCQQWTENVRDFNVKNGEEANRLTVLAYNRIIDEEQLNENVMYKAIRDISEADCLIVGGTSLMVYPAAGMINYFNGKYLVLINLRLLISSFIKAKNSSSGKSAIIVTGHSVRLR